MPRKPRSIVGGLIYHVLNRANARATLFETDGDYGAFERVLSEAQERYGLRLLGYCVMPNHWHLVVWPEQGADRLVSDFMRWLAATHTQRWHAFHQTVGTGHLYQGRFKSFPMQRSGHLLNVLRYIERNPLRAGLVRRAELWKWSSLARWACEGEFGTAEGGIAVPEARPIARRTSRVRPRLTRWPVVRPADWLDAVNRPETEVELAALRNSANRGCPYGDADWRGRMIASLGIEHTIRRPGRPRKKKGTGVVS